MRSQQPPRVKFTTCRRPRPSRPSRRGAGNCAHVSRCCICPKRQDGASRVPGPQSPCHTVAGSGRGDIGAPLARPLGDRRARPANVITTHAATAPAAREPHRTPAPAALEKQTVSERATVPTYRGAALRETARGPLEGCLAPCPCHAGASGSPGAIVIPLSGALRSPGTNRPRSLVTLPPQHDRNRARPHARSQPSPRKL